MDRIGPIAHIVHIDQGVNLCNIKENCLQAELVDARILTVVPKNEMPNQNELRQILIRFDGRVFSLPAVKKAAYKYINSFSVVINLEDNEIVCSLTFASLINEEQS